MTQRVPVTLPARSGDFLKHAVNAFPIALVGNAFAAAGMRAVLTDDEVHHQLVTAARARPQRTWEHYAREVWSALAD